MDIDRYDLWSDRGDVSVRELWQTYARYPYMARLSSFAVLTRAISDGTANMNWTQETFAYAEDHDGEQWVGIRKAQHVAASPAGLLVYPDFVPSPAPPEEDEPDSGGADQPGGADAAPPEEPGPATGATRFYAQFDLDPVRGIKQLGQILEHVSARLGPQIELSLEVRATNPDGYDDATRRIVSENAGNLGASASEFD